MALLLEIPYDDITVQQVLDRADVGRSTFYTHFQDKDELLMSGTDDLRVMLTAAQQRGRSSRAPENAVAFSRAMFEHAYGYRPVYHALVSTRVWPHVRQRIQNILADLIRRECGDAKKSKANVPIELFVHYVATTFMTVLTWWIDRRNSMTAEEIDRVFRSLVMPAARAMLG